MLTQIAHLRDQRRLFLNIPTVTHEGKLSAAAIELFQFSPLEVGQLQAAIDGARSTLQRHRSATARLEQADESSITISTPPFDGAGPLYTATTEAFEKVLGKDRFAVFDAIQSDSFNKDLNSFGAEINTYSVFSAPDGSYVFTEIGDLGKGGKPIPLATMRLRNISSFPDQYLWMEKFTAELKALKPSKD